MTKHCDLCGKKLLKMNNKPWDQDDDINYSHRTIYHKIGLHTCWSCRMKLYDHPLLGNRYVNADHICDIFKKNPELLKLLFFINFDGKIDQ